MNIFGRVRKVKTAAVLGCGPAGLFAAHALVGRGYEVFVFSRKRRSEMYGAQYLHAPIPGLNLDLTGRMIKYGLISGTVEGYREKVYGRQNVTVSPEQLTAPHPAWNIRLAYLEAWDLYQDKIINVPDIGPEWVQQISLKSQFDMVASSIPLPSICAHPDLHHFESREIWAIGDAPERGIFAPVEMPNYTVWLHGAPDVGWYRSSNIFGYKTTEWPGGRKPPISGVSKVVKPIRTDCDCFKWIKRVGRYGTWTKGTLAHQAYHDLAR